MRELLGRLTTERAATAILFLLLFALASRAAMDPDMWWHIRLGQQSADTSHFVYADEFSHTQRGSTHKNHSWLAQVVIALLWRQGGHLGLTIYVASLAVAGMFFVYRAGRGSVYMQGFVLVIGGACAGAFWSPRPQMFTFLFAALLLYLLRRLKRKGQAPLWSLLPIMWLWANLHGGYIVGYLFISAFVLGESLNRRLGNVDTAVALPDLGRLAGITVLSLALLPINPLGLDVFTAPFETLGISGMREYIQEWQSPDFAQPITWSFVILVLALVAVSWASKAKLDFADLLLVGGTLFMALYSARHLSLFAITVVPVISAHMDTILERNGWTMPRRSEETLRRSALNLMLIVLVALGAMAHVAYVSSRDTVDQALALNYPAEAVEFLKESGLSGKIFNSYNWGGYLILNLPEFPVFIDGRADLHRESLAEYAAAAFGRPQWSEVFARREIDIAIIETDGPLAWRLDEDENWRQAYRDDVASVYTLRRAETGSVHP